MSIRKNATESAITNTAMTTSTIGCTHFSIAVNTPPSANTEKTTKKLNALMRWSALNFQWSQRY